VITRYRNKNANLRSPLQRILQHAGDSQWPKLFQNLRSTRETELGEKYPIHVVCAWLGNSPSVAKAHYLQVTEEHFDRAAKRLTENARPELGGTESGTPVAQKAAQQPAAGLCKDSQEMQQPLGAHGVMHSIAVACECLQNDQVPPVGLEPTTL
jgi:hypothetical protein